MRSMGLKTFGFGFGREDIWGPETDVYWGAESEWLAPTAKSAMAISTTPRRSRTRWPASHMGLIYVNPEGVNGSPTR
jgi:catalase-peroxidase